MCACACHGLGSLDVPCHAEFGPPARRNPTPLMHCVRLAQAPRSPALLVRKGSGPGVVARGPPAEAALECGGQQTRK
eukprot:9459124-Pyramimonas_sp.AAC.1